MAEWPFTDFFFEGDITALRGAGDGAHANFGPFEAALTDCPKHVGNSHQSENYHEKHDENKFGGNQRANEIELQDEKRGGKSHKSLAHFRFSDQVFSKRFKLG
jgi:hypothetical protein